jgi:hypothetical protein
MSWPNLEIPVMADEVVPGDNVSANLDALIDRAAVMVVDLTSPWARSEYRDGQAKPSGALVHAKAYQQSVKMNASACEFLSQSEKHPK